MVVVELGRQGGGEGGRLKLLVLVHLGVLLQLVVVDDVLVGRARLGERVQLVHVAHVAPDGRQRPRDLKFRKVLACTDGDGVGKIVERGLGDLPSDLKHSPNGQSRNVCKPTPKQEVKFEHQIYRWKKGARNGRSSKLTTTEDALLLE